MVHLFAGMSWMTDLQAHTLLGRFCHIKIILSINRSDINFSIMLRTEQVKQRIKSNDWWVFWKVLVSRKCCPRNITQKSIPHACVFVSMCVSVLGNIPVCQINIH
jgi:hypothetical protein